MVDPIAILAQPAIPHMKSVIDAAKPRCVSVKALRGLGAEFEAPQAFLGNPDRCVGEKSGDVRKVTNVEMLGEYLTGEGRTRPWRSHNQDLWDRFIGPTIRSLPTGSDPVEWSRGDGRGCLEERPNRLIRGLSEHANREPAGVLEVSVA